MTHSFSEHDSPFMFGTRLIHFQYSFIQNGWVMSHTWMGRDAVFQNDAEFVVDNWIVSPCPTYAWVMVHICMSHVPHMNVSWPTYEWVMAHIWMSHVSHMNESCPTYEWVIHRTVSLSIVDLWVMSHDPRMNKSCPTCERVMSHIWMSHVSHMHESCPTYEWVIHRT